MNKYKKLILSLTISLLSFTGVWAMAKPIPQFKTYREFASFVNQYQPGEFLSNKQVFGSDKKGLLEVLLDGYNTIPNGTKPQAEALFRAKFGLSSSELSNKLSALDASKAIPVTIAQAQKIINQNRSQFQNQLAKLNGKFATLKSRVTTYRGNVGDLETIEDDVDDAGLYILSLNSLIDVLEEERDQLKDELSTAKNAGASAQQLAPLQKQLTDADNLIADQQAQIKTQEISLKQIRDKIKQLEAITPESEKIRIEYSALADSYENFYMNDVQNQNLPSISEINKMSLKDAQDSIAHLDEMADRINNGRSSYELQANELATRWTAVADKSKQNEIDAQLKKLQNTWSKIKQKLVEIREATKAAVTRVEGLLEQENKKAGLLIQQLKDIEKKYADFWPENSKNVVFTQPNVTLFELNDDFVKGRINEFNSKLAAVKNPAELTKAVKKFNKIVTRANDLHNNLKAEMNKLDLKAIPLFTPEQQNAFGTVQRNISEYAKNFEGFPTEASKLVQAIKYESDQRKTIPYEDPVAKAITEFTGRIPLADELTNTLNEEADLDIENMFADKLEEALLHAQALKLKYQPFIDEFDSFKNLFATHPSAVNVLNSINDRIKTIKAIISKANENEQRIDVKIKSVGGEVPTQTVTGVIYSKTELKFKLGSKEFVVNEDEDDINTFITEVSTLNKEVLKAVGESIAAEINKNISNDTIDKDKKLAKLFATLIYGAYLEAKNQKNGIATTNIKELVKPLFKAYSDQDDSIFKQSLQRYELTISDLP